MQSTIRLFKAVPIASKKRKKASKGLLEKTIKKGFVFSPEVIYNYSEKDLNKLVTVVEKEIGLTAKELNSSFHKSWRKVKEASLEQLVLEQIIHYLTTYGFEELGFYNKDSVYIPNEKLDIPKIKVDKINLFVIKGYTKSEFKEKLLQILRSGIALAEDTMKDVVDTVKFVGLDKKEIDSIKNKEVRVALYSHLRLFPENPVEFLRYAIYKSIGKTILIKDSKTLEEIKESKNIGIFDLFFKYQNKYGLERLSEIFYRFKPLFLSFKTRNKLKPVINKIRKLAVKYHKPMKEDYLNEVTAKIKKGVTIGKKLEDALEKVNTFRKIRLAYALNFRTKDADSILYRIRNGKGYATGFNFKQKNTAKRVLDIVLNSIVKDVGKNVKGKKIYIPEHITYALPATEKQFTGDFPSGTYISIPKDMVVGVHWENVKSNRIDLDLSMMSPTTGKIGWDSSYRTEDKSILFSGDITDAPAPRGATELFYVRKQKLESFILFVNYFNCEDEDESGEDKIEVPFKIIVAKEQVRNFKNNYMVDPNNVLSIAKSKIDQKQKILGLLVTTTDECRFYFAETYLGRSITSSETDFVENSRKYLFNFYRNTISLNKILVGAKAKMVKDREKCDIDLSPEKLEKDKIINLITG